MRRNASQRREGAAKQQATLVVWKNQSAVSQVNAGLPVCRLLLTWLQAALFARFIDHGETNDEQREEIVAIFEVAADELRRIARIGGGDPWAVAEWASVMLAPHGFATLPSNLDELHQALLHPPELHAERSPLIETSFDTHPTRSNVDGGSCGTPTLRSFPDHHD